MCDEKVTTEKSLVAFIDILGASELIEEDPDGSLKTIHECYEGAREYMGRWENDSFIIPDVKIFSDNIILSIPLNDFESDKALFPAISIMMFSAYIQVYFWINKILVRGAITAGSYYMDEMMAWGNGLVKAHCLESSIAIYPRIIIDPEIDNIMTEMCGLFKIPIITQDFDGIYFIDPYGPERSKRIYSLISDFIKDNEERIAENTGKYKILQKLNWLQRYFQEKILILDRC